MEIVELPLIVASISPAKTVERMIQDHVSACVVSYATEYHLLKLDRVVESLTEWSTPPLEVGRLIIPDELTGGLPQLSGDEPELRRMTSSGLSVGEIQLDRFVRRYGLVRVTPMNARVATRSERLVSGLLRTPPDFYKCTVDAAHIYRADKLGGVLKCPNIAHPPPKPTMVKL